MGIIKTKVDNSNGFGDGTLKAVKEAQRAGKVTLTVLSVRRQSMLSIILSMIAIGLKIRKLPMLKKHLADVKYFAPLQILCGGADAIDKEMG